MEHLANKVAAAALIFLGMVPIVISHDGTAMVLLAIPALFLFFSKENWFYGGK